MLDPPSMKGREQCETKSKAASCALPLWVQAVGGSSTRASSREERTRSSARSWAGTRPGPQRALPRSAVPPTRTSTRCSTAERPDLVTVCLPNEGHFEPTLQLRARAESRCSWRSRWSSTSTRPTRCCVKPTSAGCSSRSTSTIGTPSRSLRAKAAIDARRDRDGPSSRPGDSGARRTTARRRHANLIETQCHGFDMLEHLVGPIASVGGAHDGHDLRRLEHHRHRAAVRERGRRHHARQLRQLLRVPRLAARRGERHLRAPHRCTTPSASSCMQGVRRSGRTALASRVLR